MNVRILNPDATVLVLCAAATEPVDCTRKFSLINDQDTRKLSAEGRRQAEMLNRWLYAHWNGRHSSASASSLVFAFASAARRATETMHTAIGAMRHFIFTGGDFRLYLPLDDADRIEILNLRKALRQCSLDPSDYGNFLEYGPGTMERYRDGVRACISEYKLLAKRVTRMLIITHPVAANAVVHALFPQHLDAVRHVQLGPAEGFLVTQSSCKPFKATPTIRTHAAG